MYNTKKAHARRSYSKGNVIKKKQEEQEKEEEDIRFGIRLTKTTIVVIIITIIKHH